MDRFTQNLRRARKAAGLTQQQLADRLHVTRQSVSSWELGRTEPDLQTLTELAEVFGTDAGSLLGEAGRPAYPRLQKRFVTGFVVCAGLLLAVSGLELGLLRIGESCCCMITARLCTRRCGSYLCRRFCGMLLDWARCAFSRCGRPSGAENRRG